MKKQDGNKLDLASKLGIFASSLFVTATAVYIWSPVLGTNADDSAVSRVQVKSNSVISLTLDTNDLHFSLAPTESGTFSSQAITATITTNSVTGYELYFSAEDDNTDMTSTGATTVIASDFDGTVTSSTMAKDKWGYSLDNTDFSKIPALSNQATIRNINHMPSAAEKVTPVYIGTKVSTNLQAGSYSKNVEFSAVAHETPDLPFGGIRNMQEMTPAVCEAASAGETGTLTDTRDGNTYTVKKLADGRCWMMQNLSIVGKTISSADSNLPAGTSYTIPSNTLSEFNFNMWERAYADETDGGFYTFMTATAGWGISSKTSGTSPMDICPKGWKLPTSGETGEFQALLDSYSSSTWRSETGFTAHGFAFAGSISLPGDVGYYWSPDIKDDSSAFALLVPRAGNGSSTSSHYKYGGVSVRCIAKEAPAPTPTPTMQTFDKTTLVNVGDSVTLEDERDGNFYTVKKLADGNVWMTENLRLGKDTPMTLHPSDSDIASDFEIPASAANFWASTVDAKAVYIDIYYGGGFYNFYTATAGEGETSKTSGDVAHSICPKGWRLPTGGASGEFYALYNQYNSVSAMMGSPNFNYFGQGVNNEIRYQGSRGGWWSSTISSGTNAHLLFMQDAISSSSVSVPARVNPADSNMKRYGFSVRCLAR